MEVLSRLEEQRIGHDLDDGKQRTKDVLTDEKIRFQSILLREEIQSGLQKNGFIYLSSIQKTSLPLALTGCSMVIHGKSGTGKTLIFTISALHHVLLREHRNLQVIILAPTREIAAQNAEVITKVGCNIEGLKVECFIGGTDVNGDVVKAEGCQIAVGTPGRINHLIESAVFKTHAVRLLVLDEVDQLLFQENVTKIISHLPDSKQVIVCSATLNNDASDLLSKMNVEFKYVTAEGVTKLPDLNVPNVLLGLKHFIAPISGDRSSVSGSVGKKNKILQVLYNTQFDQCFVFVNYITQAKSLCNFLNSSGLNAVWITSEQDQDTRLKVIRSLKMHRNRVLVTTDVASRGIDVSSADLVINMGIPFLQDSYVHRSGRVGRFGSEGIAVTILFDQEIKEFEKWLAEAITMPLSVCFLPPEINDDLKKYAKCNELIRVIEPRPPEHPTDNDIFHQRTGNRKRVDKGQESKKKSKCDKKKKSKTKKQNTGCYKDEKKTQLLKEDVITKQNCLNNTTSLAEPPNKIVMSSVEVPSREKLPKEISNKSELIKETLSIEVCNSAIEKGVNIETAQSRVNMPTTVKSPPAKNISVDACVAEVENYFKDFELELSHDQAITLEKCLFDSKAHDFGQTPCPRDLLFKTIKEVSTKNSALDRDVNCDTFDLLHTCVAVSSEIKKEGFDVSKMLSKLNKAEYNLRALKDPEKYSDPSSDENENFPKPSYSRAESEKVVSSNLNLNDSLTLGEIDVSPKNDTEQKESGKSVIIFRRNDATSESDNESEKYSDSEESELDESNPEINLYGMGSYEKRDFRETGIAVKRKSNEFLPGTSKNVENNMKCRRPKRGDVFSRDCVSANLKQSITGSGQQMSSDTQHPGFQRWKEIWNSHMRYIKNYVDSMH